MPAELNFLKTILEIFISSLKNSPVLLLILGVFFIFAAAVCYIYRKRPSPMAIVGLIIVTFAAFFVAGVHAQRSDVSKLPRVRATNNANTVNIFNDWTREQKEDLIRCLQGAVADAAAELKLSTNVVRGNLFGIDEHHHLKMVPEMTVNMLRPEEFTLSIPVGYGSAGRAFQNKEANIAVVGKKGNKSTIADEEQKKVHPDLRWIISIPVLGGNNVPAPILIMNIDGIKEARSEESLRKALPHLFHWSYAISLVLKHVRPGEEYKVGRGTTQLAKADPPGFRVAVGKITPSSIGQGTEEFWKTTNQLSSLRTINSFTKENFNTAVKERFGYNATASGRLQARGRYGKDGREDRSEED